FDAYNFPGQKVMLPYFDPAAGQSIQDYASKMAASIRHEPFALVGVSLGGILAQEIAAIKKVEKLVLVSTIRHCRQVPLLFRSASGVAGTWGIKLAWKTDISALRNYFFTATRPEDKAALQRIYESTDYRIVQWAIPKIMSWTGTEILPGTATTTIHGRKDRLFPVGRRADINHLLPDAGHFMIVSHRQAVEDHINRCL
ncbi:MAG: alpha/beta hydrolase, partial [Cyclobacteriaceae bacterium]